MKVQTERIKMAHKLLCEWRKKPYQGFTMGKTMIKVGFTESYSRHPGVMMRNKVWRKLEEAYNKKYRPWLFGG